MGYILLIVLVVLIVPPLFLFLMRGRTPRPDSSDTSKTVATEPAAEDPTPTSGPVNKISPEAGKRIPPS